jgi:dTDP-4-dehydrorhamnose 3,5-epimerase
VKLERASIGEVLVLEPEVFGDARGFFMETWNARVFAELGIKAQFVQDNHSSSSKNVLRGLHYQVRQPQGKLVRVTAGEIWDVAVDLRRSSPNFGRWTGLRLDAAAKRMLWIPAGFAHGFLVLSETAEVQYKTSDYYAPDYERTLLWNDPALAIDWPAMDTPTGQPVMTEKDRRGAPLSRAETYP